MSTKTSTRPLNGFMAFRAYYSPIFQGFEQKQRSSYIGHLWQSEPLQAKWAIVAQVYSEVKEQVVKSQASLEDYLNLTIPVIGLFDRNCYLQRMGWFTRQDQAGITEIYRVFQPNFEELPENVRTTKLSSNDLLDLCAMAGYYDPTTRKNRHGRGMMISRAKRAKKAKGIHQKKIKKASATAQSSSVLAASHAVVAATSSNVGPAPYRSDPVDRVTAGNTTTNTFSVNHLPAFEAPYNSVVASQTMATHAIDTIAWATSSDSAYGDENEISFDMDLVENLANDWIVGEFGQDEAFSNLLLQAAPGLDCALFGADLLV